MIKHVIFFIVCIIACVLLAIFVNLNSMFMFMGIMSGLLFFNVTLSTMTNVLTGAMVQPNDTFWRIFLLLLCALFIALGIYL